MKITWVLILLIFWLAVYMLSDIFFGNGWLLVGVVLCVSIGGMGIILWNERTK